LISLKSTFFGLHFAGESICL